MKERIEKILSKFMLEGLCYDADSKPIGIATNAYELIKELWAENQTIVSEYKLLTENLASMQQTNEALLRRFIVVSEKGHKTGRL